MQCHHASWTHCKRQWSVMSSSSWCGHIAHCTIPSLCACQDKCARLAHSLTPPLAALLPQMLPQHVLQKQAYPNSGPLSMVQLLPMYLENEAQALATGREHTWVDSMMFVSYQVLLKMLAIMFCTVRRVRRLQAPFVRQRCARISLYKAVCTRRCHCV
jgi:hypothetical protein